MAKLDKKYENHDSTYERLFKYADEEESDETPVDQPISPNYKEEST